HDLTRAVLAAGLQEGRGVAGVGRRASIPPVERPLEGSRRLGRTARGAEQAPVPGPEGARRTRIAERRAVLLGRKLPPSGGQGGRSIVLEEARVGGGDLESAAARLESFGIAPLTEPDDAEEILVLVEAPLGREGADDRRLELGETPSRFEKRSSRHRGLRQ